MADETPDTPQRDPGIGSDEWVARSGANVERGRLGDLVARVELLPPLVRYGLLILPIAAYPAVANTDYLLQVGLDTLIYVLLALGLNVAVGWAGIPRPRLYRVLRVRRVRLRAARVGAVRHPPAGSVGDPDRRRRDGRPRLPARPAVATALRRLPRDRHALLLPGLPDAAEQPRPAQLPGLGPQDITGGPNGISDIDPFSFFGWTLTTVTQYYYVAVVALAVVMTALYLVNHSRTGRAWRALREDDLAAEVMSMPVDWLKLLAFAFGAGVAGLTGTILAAEQGAVFPVNFDLTISSRSTRW